jgi:hypothetical protein
VSGAASIAAALAAVSLMSCIDLKPRTSRRDLPGLPLSVELPTLARVSDYQGGAYVEIAPGTPSAPALSVVRLPDGEPGSQDWQTKHLGRGLAIRYGLVRYEAASGGGEEGRLDGHLTVGGETYGVRCHERVAWPARPPAQDCLEALRTVRHQ